MKSVLCTDNTFCQSGVVGAFCGIEVLWIVGPGLVARSDVFGVVHKSFPDQVGVKKCFVSYVCCQCTFDKRSVVEAGWC